MKEIIKHKFSHLLFFLLLVSCFASAYLGSRTGIPNSRPFPARYADRAQGTFFERALEGMEQGTCRLTRRIFPFIWVGQYATGLYHK